MVKQCCSYQPPCNRAYIRGNTMTNFKQYADCNLYFSHSTSDGRLDDNDYHNHRTLERSIIADVTLEGHPNEDKIIEIMMTSYRPEDMPSNGSTEGYIKGNLVHNPDTRDLAEQAGHPVNYWANMMLAYQVNIRKLARWVGGFHPHTKHELQFLTKLRKTKARMKANPKYAKTLAKRWQLLKMCNKSLC